MRYVSVFLLVISAILLTGCKTKERVVELRDTLYINKTLRDSIYQKDSIYVWQYADGDTVYKIKDRWHIRYQDKAVTDTMYVSKDKYIRYTVTEKHPWWKDYLMWFSVIVSLLLLATLTIYVVYHKTHKREAYE